MKREYRKPTIEIVDIETTEACLQAVSWRVKDEKNYDPSTDHGYIIEDNGASSFDKKKDDAWNADNW